MYCNSSFLPPCLDEVRDKDAHSDAEEDEDVVVALLAELVGCHVDCEKDIGHPAGCLGQGGGLPARDKGQHGLTEAGDDGAEAADEEEELVPEGGISEL